MKQVFNRLWVGDDSDCNKAIGWPIIHACKTCHRRKLGYDRIHEKNPFYLSLEDGNDLFLNIIDPPRPLFRIETFRIALNFMKKHWATKEHILVHCNQGRSRSGSILLVFLAHMNYIDNVSYEKAKRDFKIRFPEYSPGTGIEQFLSENWNELMREDA